jgi:hypothetical protein
LFEPNLMPPAQPQPPAQQPPATRTTQLFNRSSTTLPPVPGSERHTPGQIPTQRHAPTQRLTPPGPLPVQRDAPPQPTVRLRRGVTASQLVPAPTDDAPSASRPVACAYCRGPFQVPMKPHPFTVICVHCGKPNQILP